MPALYRRVTPAPLGSPRHARRAQSPQGGAREVEGTAPAFRSASRHQRRERVWRVVRVSVLADEPARRNGGLCFEPAVRRRAELRDQPRGEGERRLANKTPLTNAPSAPSKSIQRGTEPGSARPASCVKAPHGPEPWPPPPEPPEPPGSPIRRNRSSNRSHRRRLRLRSRLCQSCLHRCRARLPDRWRRRLPRRSRPERLRSSSRWSEGDTSKSGDCVRVAVVVPAFAAPPPPDPQLPALALSPDPPVPAVPSAQPTAAVPLPSLFCAPAVAAFPLPDPALAATFESPFSWAADRCHGVRAVTRLAVGSDGQGLRERGAW